MHAVALGDTTSNLMWRLDHGESPADAGVRVLVLLIGANDLGIAAREVRRLIRQMLPWSVRFQDEAKVIGTVGHVTVPASLNSGRPAAWLPRQKWSTFIIIRLSLGTSGSHYAWPVDVHRRPCPVGCSRDVSARLAQLRIILIGCSDMIG